MSADPKLALSWSLRWHHVGGTREHRYHAGRQGKVQEIALCDPTLDLYGTANLRSYGFRESALGRDHPTCKRCERKARALSGEATPDA